MIAWLKSFWAAHKITTHSLAIGFATLVTLYAAVPAFANLVNQVYAVTPAWFHDVVVAALGVYAFYHGTTQAK